MFCSFNEYYTFLNKIQNLTSLWIPSSFMHMILLFFSHLLSIHFKFEVKWSWGILKCFFPIKLKWSQEIRNWLQSLLGFQLLRNWNNSVKVGKHLRRLAIVYKRKGSIEKSVWIHRTKQTVKSKIPRTVGWDLNTSVRTMPRIY